MGWFFWFFCQSKSYRFFHVCWYFRPLCFKALSNTGFNPFRCSYPPEMRRVTSPIDGQIERDLSKSCLYSANTCRPMVDLVGQISMFTWRRGWGFIFNLGIAPNHEICSSRIVEALEDGNSWYKGVIWKSTKNKMAKMLLKGK